MTANSTSSRAAWRRPPAGSRRRTYSERADEHDAPRRPASRAGRRAAPRQPVTAWTQPGEQEARVQERAVVRREVVAVADQPVLGRLADPGEVLELVRGEHAVGAGDRAALGEQRGEHGERQPGERHQRGELDAVEAEPRRQRVEPARAPALGGGGGGHGGHGNRSAAAQGAAEAARRPARRPRGAALLDGVRERAQVLLAERPAQHAPCPAPAAAASRMREHHSTSGRGGLAPSAGSGATARDPLARGRVRGRVVEQLAAGRRRSPPRRPGATVRPSPSRSTRSAMRVAAGGDHRQARPEVVEHPRAEREARLEVIVVRGHAEVRVEQPARRARRRGPSRG